MWSPRASADARARPGEAWVPWQKDVADCLWAAGADTVAYVPDSRLSGVVAALGERTLVRSLTREEECVAYATGFAAAGRRSAVMMQCSGVGNMLNALASFTIPYGIGLPLIVAMRGTLGESNPSQVPMGQATPGLFAALGVQTFEAVREAEVGALVKDVLTLAWDTGRPAAVLLSPRLGGRR
jgi:sulfopyruvate decarboxylase subunit alpha